MKAGAGQLQGAGKQGKPQALRSSECKEPSSWIVVEEATRAQWLIGAHKCDLSRACEREGMTVMLVMTAVMVTQMIWRINPVCWKLTNPMHVYWCLYFDMSSTILLSIIASLLSFGYIFLHYQSLLELGGIQPAWNPGFRPRPLLKLGQWECGTSLVTVVAWGVDI